MMFETAPEAIPAFEGYAAVFSTPDHINDVVSRGAFKDTLQENAQIPILWQHRPDHQIGWVELATQIDYGLLIKAVSASNQIEKMRAALSKARGLSFGYRAQETTTRKDGGRTIHKLSLFEISVVTHPLHICANIVKVYEGFTP